MIPLCLKNTSITAFVSFLVFPWLRKCNNTVNSVVWFESIVETLFSKSAGTADIKALWLTDIKPHMITTLYGWIQNCYPTILYIRKVESPKGNILYPPKTPPFSLSIEPVKLGNHKWATMFLKYFSIIPKAIHLQKYLLELQKPTQWGKTPQKEVT